MNAKQRALELFQAHIALAAIDGRAFRKLVMTQLMQDTGCTTAAAATHYNTAKKSVAPVEGLGRAVAGPGVRKMGTTARQHEELQADDECFSVVEVLKHGNNETTVGRCRSHLLQGDASEDFDARVMYRPNTTWIMIRGLGPNTGDNFKLSPTEEEIKRYTPSTVAVVEREAVMDC